MKEQMNYLLLVSHDFAIHREQRACGRPCACREVLEGDAAVPHGAPARDAAYPGFHRAGKVGAVEQSLELTGTSNVDELTRSHLRQPSTSYALILTS